MLRALDEFVIEGVSSLLGFHRALLSHPCFIDGETCHGLVESRGDGPARLGRCAGAGDARWRRPPAACGKRSCSRRWTGGASR